MYNRFTDDSKKVLRYARNAAQRLAHNYVGTEHILLGLVLNEEGTAGQMLRDMGLTPTNVTRAVENIVGLGMTPNAHLVLTTGMKEAMEFAVEESKRLKQSYVGTEHILLGLLQKDDSMAAQILESMDIAPQEIAERIYAFEQGMSSSSRHDEGQDDGAETAVNEEPLEDDGLSA